MGTWGVKALESDAGLDIIDFLENYYEGKEKLVLSEVAELVIMFGKTKDYENNKIPLSNKKEFQFDKKSLEYILNHLIDIKEEKPDEDGEREYVELWKDSDSFEEWKQHLENLILGCKKLLK